MCESRVCFDCLVCRFNGVALHLHNTCLKGFPCPVFCYTFIAAVCEGVFRAYIIGSSVLFFSLHDPMAGSQHESILDLLKDYILHQEVLHQIVEKLDSEYYSVRTLLEMSDDDLHCLISELFPEGSYPGAKMGFKTAIGSRKKREHADSTAGKPLNLNSISQQYVGLEFMLNGS